MPIVAADIMQAHVHTVAADLDLPELERQLIECRVSGFPVVDRQRLVGVVARSDIVRRLCVERTHAEQISDWFIDIAGFHDAPAPAESLAGIAARVGRRLDQLKVRDVMSADVLAIAADVPVATLARTMVERHVHRLPVVRGERLVGIVTSLDVVALVASGRLGA